jgi:hypothetical protein
MHINKPNKEKVRYSQSLTVVLTVRYEFRISNSGRYSEHLSSSHKSQPSADNFFIRKLNARWPK